MRDMTRHMRDMTQHMCDMTQHMCDMTHTCAVEMLVGGGQHVL